MSDFYFETRQMTVGYDGKPLIRDIEIGLSRGQILTLIGPNGAGKSTILKTITKQLKKIGGEAVLAGEDMERMSGAALSQKMAAVLTERVRTERMTCWDVVAAGRYPYTGRLGILGPEDREKVDAALALVHAEVLRDRDFSAISDGQRQRLLLARAVCQEPEIIILDEPTSFLDVRHKLEFLNILKGLVSDRKVAVIMSLHELDLAEKVSDLVICVSGDRILKSGPPEEIFSDKFVRDLYGIHEGTFNVNFGCMELPAVTGKPEVFVIAGGGSGIPVFRRLQREGIPFAAGVLHEGDIDTEVAKSLAAELVAAPAFEEITEEAFEKAKTLLLSCKKVICTLSSFGSVNAKNRELLETAEEAGLPVSRT